MNRRHLFLAALIAPCVVSTAFAAAKPDAAPAALKAIPQRMQDFVDRQVVSGAVTLVANGGEETTFLIANSKINGAGGNGVSILGSGGNVYATVQTNGIAVTGSPISATNNGAGNVGLTAVGNAGVTTAAPATGKIVLNNAGAGTFTVIQSGTTNALLEADIGNSNNGAGVTILSAEGTITPDTPTPIP